MRCKIRSPAHVENSSKINNTKLPGCRTPFSTIRTCEKKVWRPGLCPRSRSQCSQTLVGRGWLSRSCGPRTTE